MTPDLSRLTQLARAQPKLRFTSLMGMVWRTEGLRASFVRLPERKAPGVDGMRKAQYGMAIEENLARLSHELRTLGYRPRPARRVYIPKASGGRRPLGIPSFEDRIVQDRLSQTLQAIWEPEFRDCSFGFRPGRSAHDALRRVAKVITHERIGYVVEADIKGFFDNLDHDLVLKAVAHHTDNPWVRLYIARWLRAPVEMADGTRVERTRGTPQGGVISPLLANLFMHYAFDAWMARSFPRVQFERYADDAVVHCVSETQARYVLEAIRHRIADCGLELHPVKTKIVYCKDDDRPREHEHISFDFLGYTFQPRRARNRYGKLFVSFLPAP